MTKVILNINEDGTIYYDCLNHADDHDACIIMSTLSNVLVCAAGRVGHGPIIYEPGHVHIEVDDAPYPTAEIFRTVEVLIEQAAEQYPDYIKIY